MAAIIGGMIGNMKLDESRLLAWYLSVRWLFLGVGAIALVTFVAVLLSRQLSLANLAFLFILPVIAVSGRYGLMRGSITAALSTLAFNFFLVPPRYTLLSRCIRRQQFCGAVAGAGERCAPECRR